MEIEYDEAKRLHVLQERGVDLGRAAEVFSGFHLTRRDGKHSSDTEERFTSIGMLGNEPIVVIWTLRGSARRIVTMWKANGKERKRYEDDPDRPR